MNAPFFLVSFIYGMNTYMERRILWSDLLSFAPTVSWCMLGDFNVIKNLSETNQDTDTWDIGTDEFKSCVENDGINDIQGIGPIFTWWNMQLLRPIHTKNWTELWGMLSGSPTLPCYFWPSWAL